VGLGARGFSDQVLMDREKLALGSLPEHWDCFKPEFRRLGKYLHGFILFANFLFQWFEMIDFAV
jgi:hypothetical protein